MYLTHCHCWDNFIYVVYLFRDCSTRFHQQVQEKLHFRYIGTLMSSNHMRVQLCILLCVCVYVCVCVCVHAPVFVCLYMSVCTSDMCLCTLDVYVFIHLVFVCPCTCTCVYDRYVYPLVYTSVHAYKSSGVCVRPCAIHP